MRLCEPARLVQRVDVLRHDGDRAPALMFVLALEPGQRQVRGVGLDALQRAPALVVKIVHEKRVAREAFGRRHLAVVVLGPDAVLVAEGRKPGLRGQPGSGQDHDVLEVCHASSDNGRSFETQCEGPMRTLLSWSTGKDSAWSLHVLRQQPDIEVVGLFTTVNAAFDRVAMHAVRRKLLEAQADAAGLPLHVIEIPWPCPNEAYEAAMGAFVAEQKAKASPPWPSAICSWRTSAPIARRSLQGSGIEPIFPLWGRETGALAREMIAGGLKAHLTCVDPKKLPASFAGRAFDEALLADLPDGVDPCGENGEFHSCVFAGPMFAHAIDVHLGEVQERDGFVFADLLPAAA